MHARRDWDDIWAAHRRVLRRRAGLRRSGAAPPPEHRDVSHERLRCSAWPPSTSTRREFRGRKLVVISNLARADPRALARPQPHPEARVPHLPRDAPAIPAAAYLLVLRHASATRATCCCRATSATFWPRYESRRRSRARRSSTSSRRRSTARLAAGARGGGALRAEAPARHGRAAGPGTRTPNRSWNSSRAPIRACRRRHAGLPVPADAVELAQPRPESPAAPATPPRDALTAGSFSRDISDHDGHARQTTSRCSCGCWPRSARARFIGYERSFHGRPAGLRTHVLVCLASSAAHAGHRVRRPLGAHAGRSRVSIPRAWPRAS